MVQTYAKHIIWWHTYYCTMSYGTAHVYVVICMQWTHICSSIFVVTQVKTCVWHKIGCTWVNFRVLHLSYISCTSCPQVILCVLHDSKKHVSIASCAAWASVFLCAACKLIAIFCQRRIKVYNWRKAPQQNVIKHGFKYLHTPISIHSGWQFIKLIECQTW